MPVREQLGHMNVASAVGRFRIPSVALVIATAVGVLAWSSSPVPPETGRMLGVTAFCIVLWVLTPIPPPYTGVIGIGLIGLAFSPELALVGFQSPAVWLIGFGLLMSEATRESGLATWVGEWIVDRGVPGGARSDPRRAFGYLLVSLCLGAIALALLVPSTLVRVLILAPVLQEAGAMFDARNARVGIFLAPLFATFYGSIGIFTAGLQNIIIAGIVESILEQSISWVEWTAVLFPVTTIARTALIVGVVYLLYRPAVGSAVEFPESGPSPPSTGARRMTLCLLAGVGFWVTDVFHGLHPMFGALIVVVLAFLPGVGVVDFDESVGDVDYSLLFFLGAVFAIGEGLSRTGFADSVATALLDVLPPEAPLALVLGFVFLATLLLALLMEGLAVASVVTPVFVTYATQAAIPIEPVMMTEAFALTTYFFPYQSAPLVAILAVGVVETPELIRVTAILSLVSILLLPLQFLIFFGIY